MNVPDIMLAHLTLDEYAKLVVAHEDVRLMAAEPADVPDTVRDGETPVPCATRAPAGWVYRAGHWEAA